MKGGYGDTNPESGAAPSGQTPNNASINGLRPGERGGDGSQAYDEEAWSGTQGPRFEDNPNREMEYRACSDPGGNAHQRQQLPRSQHHHHGHHHNHGGFGAYDPGRRVG